MPACSHHHFSNGADVVVRNVGVKEIAHGIHEDHLRGAPFQGVCELLRDEAKIKAKLVRMTRRPAKTFRECLGIAVTASGTDLRTPANRVPGGIGPLNFGLIRHERSLIERVASVQLVFCQGCRRLLTRNKYRRRMASRRCFKTFPLRFRKATGSD